jgi:FKBP-type peptidyl-prolyl cis-trans isomerase SlpA
MNIGPDSTVTMHFKIRLKDGSVAEDSREVGSSMTFKLSTGVFSEKAESEMQGLKAGDSKKIMLLPPDAFGDVHPANIFQVPTTKFIDLDAPLEEGLIVEFTQLDGRVMPGILREVGDTEVTVDFNHPLSGKVILLEVEVLEVADVMKKATE